MTSTEIVRNEIKRFVRSPELEVICVTGEWGVGKTYTWQTELDAARAKKDIGLPRYSYASLFGINSLEGLKLALVENLEFLDAPTESYKEKGLRLGEFLVSRVARYGRLAQGLPRVGQIFTSVAPFYFSTVFNQIVCIDDLERRGSGLELKDVFGLVSFLREQRRCKVILLLNADKLADKDKTDFATLFEKVIDARLVFAPTATEALDIALKSDDQVAKLFRGYCETLNISNIRVINKIERLVRQIVPHLEKFSPEITRQAIHSVVLFGWSKFQPNLAPPLDYYRVSSVARYLEKKRNKSTSSVDDEKWAVLLNQYGFMNTDDFDAELMRFVDTGVLDIHSINMQAEEQDRKLGIEKKTGSLEKAWRPFHDSFRDNLDEVTNSIVKGLKANVAVVSLPNLNAAIEVLNQLGKQTEGKDVLDRFVAEKPMEFWDPSRDRFQLGPLCSEVAAVVAAQQKKAAAVSTAAFDPEAELIQAAQSFDNEKIKKLAEVPVDEYYRIIKSKEGEAMRKIIYAGLAFKRIGNATTEMMEVVKRTEEALKRIAAESKLNEVRVGRYGIKLP